VPYGIQTAQTPNLITFVDLNIIQHRDIITTNENNEDGVIDGNQQRGLFNKLFSIFIEV